MINLKDVRLQQLIACGVAGVGLGVLITTVIFRNQPPQVVVYKPDHKPCGCQDQEVEDGATGDGTREVEQSATED